MSNRQDSSLLKSKITWDDIKKKQEENKEADIENNKRKERVKQLAKELAQESEKKGKK